MKIKRNSIFLVFIFIVVIFLIFLVVDFHKNFDAVDWFLIVLAFFAIILILSAIFERTFKKLKIKSGDSEKPKKKTTAPQTIDEFLKPIGQVNNVKKVDYPDQAAKQDNSAAKLDFNINSTSQPATLQPELVQAEKQFKIYYCNLCKKDGVDFECTSRDRLDEHFKIKHNGSMLLNNQKATYRLGDMEYYYMVAGREFSQDRVSDVALDRTVEIIKERFGGDPEKDKAIFISGDMTPAQISDVLYKTLVTVEQKAMVPGEFRQTYRGDNIHISANLVLPNTPKNVEACSIFMKSLERKEV